MQEIDIRIQELNKTICENIELIDFTSRGLVSQNILSQARNLVEHVAMKAYGTEHDLTVGYGDIKTSLSFIKTDNKYLFLRKFHEFLQESRSHYGSSHEGAERLILKYYKYLVELKNFVKDEYGLEILQNIDKFPVNTDKTIQEYYEKIADVLKQNRPLVQYNKGERYYVKKIKSFIVDGKVYYENTLTPVADNISKMDRFIAFSKNMIPYHYAINASIFMDEIEIKNKKMPVNVLGDFRVSIRPCELSNFAKFFGTTIKMDTGSAEYIGMMNYLTRSGASLTDIALMPEQTYQNIRSMMIGRAKVVKFIGILDICRQILLGKGPASNTLAYLLATLNNRVLKLQYYREANKRLAGLYLKYGCIPFDDMPFASNLIKHVPETSELYGCISVNGREHELLLGFSGRIEEIDKSIKEIGKKLANDFGDLIASHETMLEQAQSIKEDCLQQEYFYTQNIKSNESKKKALEAKIKIEEAKQGNKDRFSEAFNMAVEVGRLNEEIRQLFIEITREDMDEKIKHVFANISRKEDREACLNENFELTIRNKVSHQPQILSTGERQITSLAFIGALVSYAKEKTQSDLITDFSGGDFPIVMDSAFGNLDPTHKANVAKGLPQLASQVIVIISDEQWRGTVEENIAERVHTVYNMHDASDDKDGIVYVLKFDEVYSPESNNTKNIYLNALKGGNELSNSLFLSHHHILIDHCKQNKRIVAQQGAFVLFTGDSPVPIPYYQMCGIRISKNAKAKIRDELRYLFGIYTGSVYPEVELMQEEIKARCLRLNAYDPSLKGTTDAALADIQEEYDYFANALLNKSETYC